MSDDIVTRLRVLNHHAKKLAENESLDDLYRDALTRCEDLTLQAAAEIKRLRSQIEHHARDRIEYCAAWSKWIEQNDGLEIAQWCRAYADAVPYPNPDGPEIVRLIHSRLDARLQKAADEIKRLRKERDQARAEVVDRALGIEQDVIWDINSPTRKRCENYARSRGWHDLWDAVNEQERLIREGKQA